MKETLKSASIKNLTINDGASNTDDAGKEEIQSFNYYSIDYDESIYVDGAVLSLLPNGNTAQVKTLWEKNNLNNIFELEYTVENFIKLEEDLCKNIEKYFRIDIFELFKKTSYI